LSIKLKVLFLLISHLSSSHLFLSMNVEFVHSCAFVFLHFFNYLTRNEQQQKKKLQEVKPKYSSLSLSIFKDEYNLNPGLEWEDEFTGRWTISRDTRPTGVFVTLTLPAFLIAALAATTINE
jgi:hypothetical protein